jgi:glycerol kinase
VTQAPSKAKHDNIQVAAIGITNQRETTVVWDRVTGQPVYNAIVWQDRRTANYCESLRSQGFESQVTSKTGLLLDPYFSGTKVNWILENVAGVRDRAERGELVFGTIDSFLIWRLTEGRVHATDATNASRTLLLNIHDQSWDQELLDMVDVPKSLLADVRDSSADYGVTSHSVIGAGIQIGGVAGDQHS